MSCFRLHACVLVSFLLLSSFHANGEALMETTNDGISEEQPRSGGVYRIPLRNEPPTLDPAFVEDLL